VRLDDLAALGGSWRVRHGRDSHRMFAFSTGISRGDGNRRCLDDYDAVHF
jgi:hypothetical protein